MLSKVFIVVLLTSFFPSTLLAQESDLDTLLSEGLDFQGPQIRSYFWDPIAEGDKKSARFQADITDDDQLEFARLSLSLRNGLRCDSQTDPEDSIGQSILNLSSMAGRKDTYEAKLQESQLKAQTGAEQFSDACYRLEAQDRSGNMSFHWIDAPSITSDIGLNFATAMKTGEEKSSSIKYWGSAVAAALIVALLVSSASSSSSGGDGSNDTLIIRAPVPEQ